MDWLNQSTAWLSNIIWSEPLVFLCLGAGVLFSIRTRFMQVRHVKEMIRLMLSNKSTDSGVSSFQALTMSLSGRVGVGNITGVITAITIGGPGAVFWMWLVAFLGASTSYVECTLGQIYKTKDDTGHFRGGPAYYIEKAMGLKWYAIAFAIVAILGMGFLLPAVQANSIASSMEHGFGISTLYVFIGVALVLLLIIAGGVKGIAKFTEYVVPLMAFLYILTALIVMLVNITEVPGVFVLIFKSAFGLDAAVGAVIGQAVMMGVKRGLYSNEAGQGSGPHSAAAAEVKHPAEQGYVQAFSIYVDTLMVCSATAFLVLITGSYNVKDPANKGQFLVERLPGIEGSALVSHSIDTVLTGFGSSLVAISLLFFAFTTIVAYYYMAETNVNYLVKSGRSKLFFVWLLRLGVILSVAYGTFNQSDAVWNVGDIGVGLMAWFNIVAILIIQKPALLALKDYEKQRQSGQEIRFNPVELGIKNADYWETQASEKRR